MNNCYSNAAITINQVESKSVGGIIGELSYVENPVAIENCYFAGTITDNIEGRVGKGSIIGLATRNDSESITLNNCYGNIRTVGTDALYNGSYGGDSFKTPLGCATFDSTGALTAETAGQTLLADNLLEALNTWVSSQSSEAYLEWSTDSQISDYPFLVKNVLDRIEVTTQPKLEYIDGDALDLSGMVVTAYYTDGSFELLSYTDVTASLEHNSVLTINENGAVITVSYNGKSTQTEAITVEREQSDINNYWFILLKMLYNQQFDITATATEGGTISPMGASNVKHGNSITYTITPDDGYMIADVIVDGESVGAVSEYTFEKVKEEHSIMAAFSEIPWSNPYSDVSEDDWFYEDVKFAHENGWMNGTADNEFFAPDMAITRAMVVTILWRMEGEPVVNYLMQFEDVPQDTWYTEAVRWASANGLVLGYADGLFYPDQSITREQLAAILHRYTVFSGKDSGVILPILPQYEYSTWAENDVIWADMNGLIDGIGSDMSNMTAEATRAEMAAMLRRLGGM